MTNQQNNILGFLLKPRVIYASGVILCVLLMAAALYFEHVMDLEPCPLCAFQRLFVIALGVIALVAAIHNPAKLGRRLYASLALLPTIAGIVVAGRHVWLQSLPPEKVPSCGPGLGFILDAFPLLDALEMIFKGSGECAEVQWMFLGLTLPGWTLVVFIGMLLAIVYLLFAKSE